MSRILAWCAGATTGYIAGWLAGSAVRDRVEARRLGRPGPRTVPGTGAGTPEAGNGPQNGAQWLDQAELHARPDYQEAIRRAEGRPWEPGVDLVAYMADRKADDDQGVDA